MGKELILACRPNGMPDESQFTVRESQLPQLGDGEVEIDSIVLSVDPYIRPIIGRAASVGSIVPGSGIALVTATRSEAFSKGDLVRHRGGLRDKFVCKASGLVRFTLSTDLPLTTQIHALGGIGLCAYGGLIETGRLKPGEQVYVSAAAGAVGPLAVQIAKLKGCHVVGSASSPEKAEWIVRELKADAAVSYRAQNVPDALRTAMPRDIDIYFDNVGGDHLDAALPLMNTRGRIPVCGMISSYGDDKPSVTHLAEIIYRRVQIAGFGFTDFINIQSQFENEMTAWIKAGQLKFFETELDGFEQLPAAIVGLFAGQNIGKMLVRLAPDPA